VFDETSEVCDAFNKPLRKGVTVRGSDKFWHPELKTLVAAAVQLCMCWVQGSHVCMSLLPQCTQHIS
jgi:hypothetical protein